MIHIYRLAPNASLVTHVVSAHWVATIPVHVCLYLVSRLLKLYVLLCRKLHYEELNKQGPPNQLGFTTLAGNVSGCRSPYGPISWWNIWLPTGVCYWFACDHMLSYFLWFMVLFWFSPIKNESQIILSEQDHHNRFSLGAIFDPSLSSHSV